MSAKDSTGLQRALQMEEVPKKKWTGMVGRTLLGALFAGLGVYLVVTETLRASKGSDPTQWVIYTGVGLVLLGATVWSTQVVKQAMLALVSPIKALKAAWKGTP
jgi:drug/metabolite transporter (DMT)-like permease